MRAQLESIAHGYQDAVILLTANHLGLFRALHGEPRTAADLARELDLDARGLELVLLALTAREVLHRDGAGAFALAPDAAPYLDPASEDSISTIFDHHYHLLHRWVRLDEVLRTGEPVPREGDGRSPDELRAFICGMKDISRKSSDEVAGKVLELGESRRLLDLGGGPGTSAITFCKRWPRLEAVVFDLPEVTPIAREEIAAAGLEDRITTRDGDYHRDSLGDGYDAVYVSNIIHSLSPDETREILGKAAAALQPGGFLILKDFFLADSRTEPAFGARFAVNMLVGTTGGKSYTWTETGMILADLGLQPVRHVDVGAHSGVLVARKPR